MSWNSQNLSKLRKIRRMHTPRKNAMSSLVERRRARLRDLGIGSL